MKIKTNVSNLPKYKIILQVEEAVHDFMKRNGYLKIDVPVLSPALIPESYLEIFSTQFNFLGKKENLYLTPSPEIFLKRLLAYGVGNCYYLGKAFRNSEPRSSWHLPEFTMIEFYKLGVDYLKMAEEVLRMLEFINTQVKSQKSKVKNTSENSKVNNSLIYQNKKISFEKWEKMSVAKAFEKFAGITKEELFNHELFLLKAKNKGYKVEGFSYEDIFSQIFVQEVESHLGKNGHPTLIYDYPKELASLAKLNKDGKTAQRCEFYINGLEVGGFCTELNDNQEQEQRFIRESNKRKSLHMINHAIDKGFIEALKYNFGLCTGAGIGFERLAMFFAGVDSIDKLKLITIY